MFEYKQDIGLLHGSLSSVAYPNSNNLLECANVKDAVHTVYNSVKMVVHHSLNGMNDEKEKAQFRLHVNERLHAAIFFTTLRSYHIRSMAADEFYESIVYNWPSMDLKFYLELSFKCDWSEYFIMCSLQLPSEVLYEVLKMILDISLPSDVKYYSWHLILQILIIKLLEKPYNKELNYPFNFDFICTGTTTKTESSAILAQKKTEIEEKFYKIDDNINELNEESSKTNCKGIEITDKNDEIIKRNNEIVKDDIDNSICNEIPEKNNETSEEEIINITPCCYESCEEKNEIMLKENEIMLNENEIMLNENEIMLNENENLAIFKEMFNNMCSYISIEIKESNKIDPIKILLHAMKTLTKCLALERKENNSDSLKKFNYFVKICELLYEYLKSASNQENLKVVLQTCSNLFETHVYNNASWNISCNYLAFLIEYYVVEIFPKFSSLMSFSDNDSDIFYDKIISIAHILRCLNMQFLKSDEHLALLCKVIQFEFDGSSHAARVLLGDPSTLERKNILLMLEENCHVIDLTVSYHSVIDTIMTIESEDIKLNLLKILYKCLQRSEIDMYDSLLKYVLSKYGFTAEMQLPNFHDQLSEFARQTPSLEEAEKVFPILLVQNPMTSLQYVIDAALVQGSNGKIFIQLLKPFRHICCYVKKYGHISILHKILNDYFNKTHLETYESKNMVTLYKFLMEVQLETQILLLCTFFRNYVAPKLYPDYDKIELILECTYVLMPALLSDDIFLGHSEFLLNTVATFANLVHHFILTGNGKMKSLVISILKELEIHQQNSLQITENEKIKLWSTFKDLNEVACVYIREYLPRDIEFLSKSYIWTWCCKNEDSSYFENKFSTESLTYVSLMNTLVEVFPHLTQKEWLYSINLLKFCFKNLKLKDEVVSSNNPFQLSEAELDVYAVILVIICNLHFILNDNIESSLYISSCFSNCLKNNLCQEHKAHTLLLLSTALEVCHLISCISSDLIHVYNAILLELKKEIIASCSLECDQNNCKKLLNDAVTCLPDVYKEQLTL